jgi:hypothetical protein
MQWFPSRKGNERWRVRNRWILRLKSQMICKYEKSLVLVLGIKEDEEKRVSRDSPKEREKS